MSKDFSKFTSYKGRGKAVEASGEAENTASNHNEVMNAAQRVKGNASKMCVDYSIPGKKRNQSQFD